MKKNCIVFDIDGTLTDSVSLHHDAFINALKQMGVQTMDTQWSNYKHHTDLFIAKEIYENDIKASFSEQKVLEFEQLLLKHIEKAPKINEIDGALKTINSIENHSNYAIAYATGSLRQPAMHKLNQIGIKYHPMQLTASNEILDRETIVKTAIETTKEYHNIHSFEHVISVGDGIWDLITAQHLAIDFIGIGNTHKEALLSHGCSTHFESLLTFNINKLSEAK